MANNNVKNTDIEFDEKAQKAERRQKKITQIVCFVLAALMILGGTASVLISVLAG